MRARSLARPRLHRERRRGDLPEIKLLSYYWKLLWTRGRTLESCAATPNSGWCGSPRSRTSALCWLNRAFVPLSEAQKIADRKHWTHSLCSECCRTFSEGKGLCLVRKSSFDLHGSCSPPNSTSLKNSGFSSKCLLSHSCRRGRELYPPKAMGSSSWRVLTSWRI